MELFTIFPLVLALIIVLFFFMVIFALQRKGEVSAEFKAHNFRFVINAKESKNQTLSKGNHMSLIKSDLDKSDKRGIINQ